MRRRRGRLLKSLVECVSSGYTFSMKDSAIEFELKESFGRSSLPFAVVRTNRQLRSFANLCGTASQSMKANPLIGRVEFRPMVNSEGTSSFEAVMAEMPNQATIRLFFSLALKDALEAN